MARSRITNSQVLDSDFALQAELDAVADNTTGTFSAATMNNATLRSELTGIRNKTAVFRHNTPLSLTVPAGQNFMVLTGAARPGYAVAIAAGVIGAMTARLSGSVGSHSVTTLVNNGNLCDVRTSAKLEGIYTGGCRVYALLQVGSAATDSSAFTDAGNNLGQLSFVYWNVVSGVFAPCPVADIAGQVIHVFFRRRDTNMGLDEQAFTQEVLTEPESVFGRNFAYADTYDTTQSTTSNTFVTRLSLSFTVSKAGLFIVQWKTFWGSAATNRTYEIRMLVDGTASRDLCVLRNYSTAATANPAGGFFPVSFSVGIHTADLQFRAQVSGNTITLRDSTVAVWRTS